jgi:hypothetical protein
LPPFRRIELLGPAGEIHGQNPFQLFPALGKSFSDEGVKLFPIGGDGGSAGETEDGGVDPGARVKNLRWKGADLFDLEDGLEQDGDGAVRGSAGLGGETVRHFLLQGDYHDLGRGLPEGEMHEERSGDGVREVAAENGPGGMGGQGFEGVAFDEMEAGFILEVLAEEGDEALIHLEGFHRMAGGEQGAGEGPEAWPDFLHRLRA